MSKVHFREVLLSALAAALPACGTSANAPVLVAAAAAKAAVPQPPLGELTGPLAIAAGDDLHVRLTVLAADTVRLLIYRGSERNIPASFAVDPKSQAASAPRTLEERPGMVTLRTAALGVRVNEAPSSVALLDAHVLNCSFRKNPGSSTFFPCRCPITPSFRRS